MLLYSFYNDSCINALSTCKKQWSILQWRHTWDFESCSVTVWMSGAMEGPCCPVSVNPKLGWGCEGTPKAPQRGFVDCGPDFSPTEGQSFSIRPALEVDGFGCELRLFWPPISTLPFVSLVVSVGALVKKVSRGISCDWGWGSGWVWGWSWGWRKLVVGGCGFLFGCGCCAGLVSSCCPLQFPKQLKPLCPLLSLWGLRVLFLTKPPATVIISIPPLTATTISAGGFLWFMEKSNDGCWVLGGWKMPCWLGLTWEMNCSWDGTFLGSLSVLLFSAPCALSPMVTHGWEFTLQSLFFAPSLLLGIWDFSPPLSIIFVQRCKRLLSLSLRRTPPSESPCFPSLLSFSFIFLSLSLARSCLFLRFSSRSRWRSCAVTGRRDSATEDSEDDTPPPAQASMPRAEVPPSAMETSHSNKIGLKNDMSVIQVDTENSELTTPGFVSESWLQ